MRYLADLVKSLSDAERDAVLAWPLRGKELALMDWTWQNRFGDNLRDVSKACLGIGVTEGTLFKLNSLLCQKICQVLVPSGGEALIWQLLKRRLIPQLYHEMYKQDKTAKDRLSKAEQIRWLTLCFETVQKVPVRFYEEKQCRYYARKLSATAQDPEVDAYIQARLLTTTMYMQSAGVGLSKTGPQYQRWLRKVERQVERSQKPCLKAKYFLYRAYSLFYVDVQLDMEQSHHYLEKTMGLFDVEGNPFTEEEVIITQCRLAESLYGMSRFAEALARYNELFAEHGQHLILLSDVYHRTKWIQLALINDELDLANKILNEQFKPYIDRKHPAVPTMGCISFAKYYLLKGEPEKALEFVQQGFESNKKDLYVQYEIELRHLQNTCFAMMGNTAFALDLIKNNLRYLRNKGLNNDNSSYGAYYHLLGKMMQGKKLGAELTKRYCYYHQGYFAVYGKLLLVVANRLKFALPQ